MKKMILFTILWSSLVFTATQQVGDFSQPIAVDVSGNDIETTLLTMRLGEFEMMPVRVDDEEFSVITLDDESNILLTGYPDIPDVRRSIIIPDNAKMNVRVISSEYTDYENIQVAPSKGVVYRNVDWDSVPREFGEVYEQDAFYPGNLVELNMPYILRDFRGQVVKFNPFQYNPVTKILRVYSYIEIEVFVDGLGEVNTFERQNDTIEKMDSEFEKVYDNHFVNFSRDRYTPLSDQGNMLVVYYDSFESAVIPLVEWKNMKGVPTEMIPISQFGGSSGTTLKSNIANYYNTNGLTFVLLVGDAAQIPIVSTSFGVSDISYGYISGSDSYPELFVGRFSAENIGQVNTQVERTIEYERDYSNGLWLHKGMGVASDQGPGDDGEYDNVHMNNIRTDLLGYTYTEVDQIYDPSASASQVTTALNSGRSIINYTGHGSSTSWGSSGFSNSNINSLTNDNMLPFIWSVACVNGEFMNTTCFGEAWLRATHNGEPTGAIGAFMATINQSWNPPMDGQDEMNDILIESYQNNIKRTYGGISFNGCMHMNDEYGAAGDEITDTWTIFGDPSVVVRTDTPTSMNVQAPPTLMTGTSVYQLSVLNLSGALAAISKDGVLLGSGISDTNGNITIQFDTPIAEPGEYDLIVTGYNKITHISTLIASSEPGPYLMYDSMDIDGSAEAGQTFDLFVTISNVGDEPATNVSGMLTTTDPLITILNANANYNTINNGATATNITAFSVQVSSTASDGHVASFALHLSADGGEWDCNFSITCSAIPELVVNTNMLEGFAPVGGTDATGFVITNSGTGDLNYSISVTTNGRDELDYTENWSNNSFGDWTFENGQASWVISSYDGNPAPSAEFNWYPTVTNYSYRLVSPVFDGTSLTDVSLSYDIYLSNYSATNAEFMDIEIRVSGGNWIEIENFVNSGTINWETHTHDISELVAGQNFQIAFHPHGNNSYDINNWNVDNIHVLGAGPDWVIVEPMQGNVSAGQSDEITVLFQALDIPEGTYTGALTITSNGGTEVITLTFEAGIEDPCSSWSMGDVNNDGIVNILDIVLVVNHIVDGVEFGECEFFAADFNADNIINVLDIVQIINYIFGG